MKDMSEAGYVLGIKILQDYSRRTLGLLAYTRKVLKRFNMSKAKFIDTHVIKNHSLSLHDCLMTPTDRAKIAAVPYASASEVYCMQWCMLNLTSLML